MFGLATSPVIPGFCAGRIGPLGDDDDLVANFTIPSLLVLPITIVVVALKPMLVFGREGIGAFNRFKALDKLTKLAGRWYPVDGKGRTGLDAF